MQVAKRLLTGVDNLINTDHGDSYKPQDAERLGQFVDMQISSINVFIAHRFYISGYLTS